MLLLLLLKCSILLCVCDSFLLQLTYNNGVRQTIMHDAVSVLHRALTEVAAATTVTVANITFRIRMAQQHQQIVSHALSHLISFVFVLLL